MTILQRYITRSYLTAFALGMVVLTFVLSIGLLVKATQLVIRGLPASLVLRFLFVSIPETFTFTIPLAALVSALLVFGRLSADGETNAMKACGVNLWNVMAPLVAFGVFLAALSVFINSYVAPRGCYERHIISAQTHGGSALALLEPGHFIEDFDGMTFWFESRDGNELRNLLIYDKSDSDFTREIRAVSAHVSVTNNDLVLDMSKVRVNPFSKTQPGVAEANRLIHTIKDATKTRVYRPKTGGMSNAELEMQITNAHDSKKRSEMLTELNKRFAFGLAPLAFLLLGMPLGIKTSRKESNAGIAISLCVMLLYYATMIVTRSLAKHPEFFPHIVIWLPALVCVIVSVILVRKNQ